MSPRARLNVCAIQKYFLSQTSKPVGIASTRRLLRRSTWKKARKPHNLAVKDEGDALTCTMAIYWCLSRWHYFVPMSRWYRSSGPHTVILMMPLNLQVLSSAYKSRMMGLYFLTMDMHAITRYKLNYSNFCNFCACIYTWGPKWHMHQLLWDDCVQKATPRMVHTT